jgi:hypothetical protein
VVNADVTDLPGRKEMKARLRTLVVVVMSALTAQLAVVSTVEAATRKPAIHKKHHKHTLRDLPPDDPVGSLHTR